MQPTKFTLLTLGLREIQHDRYIGPMLTIYINLIKKERIFFKQIRVGPTKMD